MTASETSAVYPLTWDSNCGVSDKAAAVVGSKTPFPYAPACIEERYKETLRDSRFANQKFLYF